MAKTVLIVSLPSNCTFLWPKVEGIEREKKTHSQSECCLGKDFQNGGYNLVEVIQSEASKCWGNSVIRNQIRKSCTENPNIRGRVLFCCPLSTLEANIP